MLLSVAIHIATIQIAAELKGFSAMGCNAELVLPAAVFFARKCGTSFNCMPGLAKSLSVMYRVASAYDNSSSTGILRDPQVSHSIGFTNACCVL